MICIYGMGFTDHKYNDKSIKKNVENARIKRKSFYDEKINRVNPVKPFPQWKHVYNAIDHKIKRAKSNRIAP